MICFQFDSIIVHKKIDSFKQFVYFKDQMDSLLQDNHPSKKNIKNFNTIIPYYKINKFKCNVCSISFITQIHLNTLERNNNIRCNLCHNTISLGMILCFECSEKKQLCCECANDLNVYWYNPHTLPNPHFL